MNPRKTIAYFSFVVLCAFLVGMGGPPGCTSSEIPLSDPEEGQTDYYLLGRWHELSVSNTGRYEVGPLVYELTLSSDGDLEFVRIDNESDSCGTMRAYTTQLGARKYLNIFLDASDCEETVRSEIEQDPCPTFIVQYSTSLPRALAQSVSAQIKEKIDAERELEKWRESHPGELEPIIVDRPGVEDPDITRALLAEAERHSGNLLFYSEMENWFVEEAIESGAIEGMKDCDKCFGACIQLNESDLRDFVEENDKDLFRDWEWLMRQQ